MAHMKKIQNGKWRIVIEVGRDPQTGKRKRVSKTVNGPKWQAEEVMHDMVDRYNKGDYIHNNHVKVGEYLFSWIERHKHKIQETTYNSYMDMIKKHLEPAFRNIRLQELRPSHIYEYQRRKLDSKLSKRSVQYHHTILSVALKQAERLELIRRSPTASVSAPSPDKPRNTALKPKQVKKILEKVEGHYMRDIIIVAVFTGLRKGELLGLKWDCVYFHEETIEIRRAMVRGSKIKEVLKNKNSHREISVSDRVLSTLKKIKKTQAENRLRLGVYYEDQGLVFCKENGQPIPYGEPTRLFREFAKDCGIKSKFHDLRHTHATLLHQSGEMELKDISARLGHAQLSTTADIYTRSNTKDKKAARILEDIL